MTNAAMLSDLKQLEIDMLDRDARDPLASFRDRFAIPQNADGSDKTYLCGNSLGLMPKTTVAALQDELEQWSRHAVEGHFQGKYPWMPYHEFVQENLAELVGAKPSEAVAMNSLTANLHLMMVSFYRPTKERHAIVIEKGAFPSDRYAVESQIRFHGRDPGLSLIEIAGDEPNGAISEKALAALLEQRGAEIALALLPGVQYLTGQVFDLQRATELIHRHGAIAGFDLAHAVGNVPVNLHASNADFAVWCSYKYLNSGPGAVAGCFVHERHAKTDRPRFAGWWGHDKSTRFAMGPDYRPTEGADGWQLSNPPILALAPLRVSLEIFHDAGLQRLREKSIALTGWLADQIETRLGATIEICTPAEPQRRGCQLSLRIKGTRDAGKDLFAHLARQGIVCDWREPDIIRIAPAPLYNRFMDCLRFVIAVDGWMSKQ